MNTRVQDAYLIASPNSVTQPFSFPLRRKSIILNILSDDPDFLLVLAQPKPLYPWSSMNLFPSCRIPKATLIFAARRLNCLLAVSTEAIRDSRLLGDHSPGACEDMWCARKSSRSASRKGKEEGWDSMSDAGDEWTKRVSGFELKCLR